jgi:hypothetical protein
VDHSGTDHALAGRVVDLWQVGVALGKHGKKFEFWKFKWTGLASPLNAEGNNKLKGIKIYFSSIFDK